MEKINVLAALVENRRSIKPAVLNGKKIDDQQVVELLTLGNWAPTHGFTEPWRFIVYSGHAVKRFYADQAALYKLHEPPETFNEAKYEKQLHSGDMASHVIAVYMKRGGNPNIPELEEICAVAAAVQNILLGAEALGIAVLWSTGGMVLKPAMKDYLQLSKADRMIGVLSLGYTDEVARPGRRGSVEAKIKWEGPL